MNYNLLHAFLKASTHWANAKTSLKLVQISFHAMQSQTSFDGKLRLLWHCLLYCIVYYITIIKKYLKAGEKLGGKVAWCVLRMDIWPALGSPKSNVELAF